MSSTRKLQIHDLLKGSAGLAQLFARLALTSALVDMPREHLITDVDLRNLLSSAVGHNAQTFGRLI